MKKIIILFAIFFATILNGCGKDGRDGQSFIAFAWGFFAISYTDNNPSIPLQISSNTQYETDAGIYTYDYTVTDFLFSYHFYGTYTITINTNKGEKGWFIIDGDDGKDRNYLFTLTKNGLQIDESKMSNGGEKKFLEKKKITNENIQDTSKIETRKFSKTFDNVTISVEEKVVKTKK